MGHAIALAVLSLAGMPARAAQSRAPAGIVVFMADTLRADALGCYGQKVFKTPSLDAFAAQGVRFENAFAQSSWTRDSVATLFTGQYHWAHGVTHRFSRLSPDAETLAALLRAAGYKTGAVNANPNIDKAFGLDKGFQDFIPLYGWQVDPARLVDPSELKAPAEKVVDAALDWIRKNKDDRFFLFVLATDPHNPYQPPAPFDKRYDAGYEPSTPPEPYGGPRPSNKEVEHQKALYGGEVSYLDAQFGRFLAGLDALGLKDDAAVVFLSDHGEEFYEHGRPFHGRTLFDPAIQVPLIVRLPGKTLPGHVARGLVEVRDLFPAILAWAGLRPPAGVDAADLSDCLGSACPGRETVVSALELDEASVEAVRGKEFKLLSFPRRAKASLFNLRLDPGESSDVRASWRGIGDSYAGLLFKVKAKSSALRKGRETPAPQPIDEKLRRKLKAMGYLE